MEKVNLPCQVIETLEKRWARKLQRQIATWRATLALDATLTRWSST